MLPHGLSVDEPERLRFNFKNPLYQANFWPQRVTVLRDGLIVCSFGGLYVSDYDMIALIDLPGRRVAWLAEGARPILVGPSQGEGVD